MKIISQIFVEYNTILQKIEGGAGVNWEEVVNEAVRNALEKADWTKLKPFRYKATKDDDGYFWKPVYVKLEYEIWKKAREYAKNGIEMDDVVNFALLFSQKFMIARMKKDILDKKWTAKRVATVIEKIAGIECVNMNSDRVRFEACPICWHEDFMVFVNNDEIPTFGYCLKCWAHNIWEILNETGTGNFVDVIHEVWEIFEEKEATAKAKNEHKQKAIQQKQQQEQQKQKQQYKTRTELEEERRRIIEENFEEPYMTPEEEYRQAQEIIQYLLKKAAERKAKTTTKAAV